MVKWAGEAEGIFAAVEDEAAGAEIRIWKRREAAARLDLRLQRRLLRVINALLQPLVVRPRRIPRQEGEVEVHPRALVPVVVAAAAGQGMPAARPVRLRLIRPCGPVHC